MNIIYEGTDITGSIEVNTANIYDNAGGIADSIELAFSDTKGLWSKWRPQKGDTIEVKESGFSSGLMFIDQLEQRRGIFVIKAISIPPDAKTYNSRAWENVRFKKFAQDIADKYGFDLQAYGIQDWQYERLDQIEQTDFEFLSYRCLLEGYILKINNKKVIIYDEKYMEQQDAVKTFYSEDIDGDYSFKVSSTGLFNSCLISCSKPTEYIKSLFKPSTAPAGPILKKTIYVSSQSEADRFSRGLLRAANKNEYPARIQVELNTDIAAGNNINISNVGLADGKYFVEQAVYSLMNRNSILKLRKPLEGY